MLLFAHLAADSYNGTSPVTGGGSVIRPPDGWEVILTTWDPVNARPTTDANLTPAFFTVLAGLGMEAQPIVSLQPGAW